MNWGRNPNRSMAQAPENWGRNPNRRRSQRLSGGRSLRRRWVSPPQKNFKMHTWNHAFWCIVETKIYIFFPSDPGIFRRRARTRFRSSMSTFKTINSDRNQDNWTEWGTGLTGSKLEIGNVYKCSNTNFHHNRRDLQVIAFSGNSSIFEHPEHLWTPKLTFTLLINATKFEKCYFSYIRSVKTQIPHAVTSMQVQKKHFRSWLGGVRPGWGGVRSNQSNPPWLQAWKLSSKENDNEVDVECVQGHTSIYLFFLNNILGWHTT